jgi:NAD(P)-dependent dehydrogenase (short-subunit alcohol dehydrogenase family)
MRWTSDAIPAQAGRTAIITGANSGIGFATAEALVRKGARVVLACRDEQRGADAVGRLSTAGYPGSAELAVIDLASLQSIRAFAGDFCRGNQRLDLLINNAGVMIPPEAKTAEGFELQIGVNFLGHFALTGRLLERLKATPGSRVVTVSSLAHRGARIDFTSFRDPKPYRPWRSYQQSKLACLIFMLELHRRLRASGSSIQSLAAHPGGTTTELQRHNRLARAVTAMLAMRPAQGALPTLYAATEPRAAGGDYIGPEGLYELRGYPGRARMSRRAADRRLGAQLWSVAEDCTGVRYLNDDR